jgi:heme-degrading monooxygenase HmoA
MQLLTGGDEMAIKVIVKRKVAKGKEAELLPLLLDLRTKATSRLGYISGETLRGVEDPQDYMVISTWLSLENWKDWESSPDRAKVQDKIDALLGEKTEYSIYFYG